MSVVVPTGSLRTIRLRQRRRLAAAVGREATGEDLALDTTALETPECQPTRLCIG